MWKDIEHELPDEEMTVLVDLDCGLMRPDRFRKMVRGRMGHPVRSLGGGLCDEEAVVIRWMHFPTLFHGGGG